MRIEFHHSVLCCLSSFECKGCNAGDELFYKPNKPEQIFNGNLLNINFIKNKTTTMKLVAAFPPILSYDE
ncbi:hypothetical protein CAP42_13170 [Acinetobacter indicus]|nr:hypothetical protein CAP42_13170 [Acinetobacter indicus]